MVGRAWWSRAVHIMAARKQRKGNIGRGQGKKLDTALVTYFLQLGPTSCFRSDDPQVMPYCYEPIKGLIHSLSHMFFTLL
jgi:hypothetical protein